MKLNEIAAYVLPLRSPVAALLPSLKGKAPGERIINNAVDSIASSSWDWCTRAGVKSKEGLQFFNIFATDKLYVFPLMVLLDQRLDQK